MKATSGFKKVKLRSQMAVFLGSNIVNLGSKIGVSVSKDDLGGFQNGLVRGT